MFLFDMVILHCYINLGDCWIAKGYPGVNIEKDVGNQWFPSGNDLQMMGFPASIRAKSTSMWNHQPASYET